MNGSSSMTAPAPRPSPTPRSGSPTGSARRRITPGPKTRLGNTHAPSVRTSARSSATSVSSSIRPRNSKTPRCRHPGGCPVSAQFPTFSCDLGTGEICRKRTLGTQSRLPEAYAAKLLLQGAVQKAQSSSASSIPSPMQPETQPPTALSSQSLTMPPRQPLKHAPNILHAPRVAFCLTHMFWQALS